MIIVEVEHYRCDYLANVGGYIVTYTNTVGIDIGIFQVRMKQLQVDVTWSQRLSSDFPCLSHFTQPKTEMPSGELVGMTLK